MELGTNNFLPEIWKETKATRIKLSSVAIVMIANEMENYQVLV